MSTITTTRTFTVGVTYRDKTFIAEAEGQSRTSLESAEDAVHELAEAILGHGEYTVTFREAATVFHVTEHESSISNL